MLGSLGNALSLLLIAGVSLSFPPLGEFLKHFGEWSQYLWNLLPFVSVSEFTAKVLTVLAISLLVLLRGWLAKHPSLPSVLAQMQKTDSSAKSEETRVDYRVKEAKKRSFLALLRSRLFRMLNIAVSILSAALATSEIPQLVLQLPNGVREGALYVAVLSMSFYYPRAFFALVWAMGLVFLANFAGNQIGPLLEAAPWNSLS